jgi:hypothetical protein
MLNGKKINGNKSYRWTVAYTCCLITRKKCNPSMIITL